MPAHQARLNVKSLLHKDVSHLAAHTFFKIIHEASVISIGFCLIRTMRFSNIRSVRGRPKSMQVESAAML